MKTTKPVMAISGWVVFAIAFTVYLITAERTGSLWDLRRIYCRCV